jgi:drug/metabolite transporter (DMT)-like permease
MWLAFSAAAAVCFGFRGILYQWTSQQTINRNLLLFSVYLSGAIVALVMNLFLGQAWTAGSWIGLIMGVLSFVANASLYRGFAEAKASLMALFTGMPPIVVVLLAYLTWGEKLNGGQVGAFAVIFCGLLLIRYSNDLTLSNLQGAQWGVLTMFMFACTDFFSKASTNAGGQTMPTLTIMYVTGAILFFFLWRKGARREISAGEDAQKPQSGEWPNGKTFAWGLFVGLSNVFGMILMLPAFRMGVTGLVSAVVAMNVLIILLYARFVLKEKFTRREIAGMTCTIAGVLILRMLG